jgi:colanic acid/amylovoran biosynthesis glycosyltransferase
MFVSNPKRNCLKRMMISNPRISEWILSKAGIPLFTFLAIHLTLNDWNSVSVLSNFFFASMTFLGFGLVGYLINDWTDLKQDLVVGKNNLFVGKSFSSKVLSISFALVLAIIPWFFVFELNKLTITLIIAQLSLYILYSVPPFRLKRIAWLGVVLDTFYANVLPTILAVFAVSNLFEAALEIWLIILVSCWTFFYGLRGILNHHLADLENDKLTKSANVFISCKRKSILRLMIYCFFLELIFSFSFLNHSKNYLNFEFEVYSVYLLMAYTLVSSFYSLFWYYLGKSPAVTHFNSSDFFTQKLYPSFILFSLCIRDLLILPLALLFFVFAFKSYFVRIYYAVSYLISIFGYETAWRIRFILPNKIKNRYSQKWKVTHERQSGKMNLAVFNENEHKYTETFVQGHLAMLDCNITFYHGKPTKFIHPYWGVVSVDENWRNVVINISRILGISEKNVVEKNLVRSLIGKEIDLVLAEFGTMGVEVFEACKKAGIPLVVIFYGYDAWHKNVISSNRDLYQAMFNYSSKIIGVSLDICGQLEKLGCSKEKIVYLPCYLDLQRFQYRDHSKNDSIILSVGRFAETKSPHLTILAFNEVLKQIPDAKLVMVGKDGGGELFEACHILAKALKIEDRIEFKGVLTPEEVKKEMDRASVFVQHSLTTPINGDKEGTPVAIMEAMACGLPVVATKHAGIAELITSGENGLLVEEYDYLSMSERIIFCLRNREIIVELGKNASHTIRSNNMLKNNNSILENILRESR